MYIVVLASLATLATLGANSTEPDCYMENYISSRLQESSVTYQEIHWTDIREHLLQILLLLLLKLRLSFILTKKKIIGNKRLGKVFAD